LSTSRACRPRISQTWAVTSLFVLIAFLPACSPTHNSTASVSASGAYSVRGKVTYRGTPLPYGFLFFTHSEQGFDPKTGTWVTTSTTRLEPDGSYSVGNLPEGLVFITVFCDPDAGFPHPVLRGKNSSNRSRGSRRPERPGLVTGGRANSLTKALIENLTPEQKKMLKEVHAEYGNSLRWKVLRIVLPEDDQQLDIELTDTDS
jgi:hypothetical protein